MLKTCDSSSVNETVEGLCLTRGITPDPVLEESSYTDPVLEEPSYTDPSTEEYAPELY